MVSHNGVAGIAAGSHRAPRNKKKLAQSPMNKEEEEGGAGSEREREIISNLLA